jgi:hypothetical protein
MNNLPFDSFLVLWTDGCGLIEQVSSMRSLLGSHD